jgi:tRNA G46 methylase TrmB
VAGIVNLLSCLWKDLAPTNWHKRICSRRFDKRFAVDTAGHVTVEELDITNNQKEQAILYQPTAAVTFGLVLSELPINYGDYVFVDYGSGKGQALIMAAFFPFKRVVGVEISYKLHLIAQNNIKRFRARMVKCRRRYHF